MDKNDFSSRAARDEFEKMALAAEQRSKFEQKTLDFLGGQRDLSAQILKNLEGSSKFTEDMALHQERIAKIEKTLSKMKDPSTAKQRKMVEQLSESLQARKNILESLEAINDLESSNAEFGQQILEDKQEIIKDLAKSLNLHKKEIKFADKLQQIESMRAILKERSEELSESELRSYKSQIDLLETHVKQNQILAKVAERTEATYGKLDDFLGGFLSKSVSLLKTWGIPLGIVALIAGPLIIGLRAAFKLFTEIDEAGARFRENTGLTLNQTRQLVADATSLGYAYAGIGVTFEEVYGAAADFLEVFSSALHPSRQLLAQSAVLSENFGISGSESAQVLANLMSMSGVSQTTAAGLSNVAVFLAESERVAPVEVFKDISQSTDQISEYMRGNYQLMLASAIEARRMGTSLQAAASTSSSLLDFQGSISREMEASVLIGQHVNFGYARQLAFQGDIVGAQQEALRVIKTTGDFLSRNVFEKRALAEAAGMTVSEVERMLMMERELGGLGTNLTSIYETLTDEMKSQVDFSRDDVAAQIQRLATMQNQKSQMDILKQQWRSIGMQLSRIFIPLIQKGLDILNGWVGQLSGVHHFADNLEPIVDRIAAKLKSWSDAGLAWIDENGGLDQVFKNIAEYVGKIVDGFVRIAPMIAAITAALVGLKAVAMAASMWSLIATGGVPGLAIAAGLGLAVIGGGIVAGMMDHILGNKATMGGSMLGPGGAAALKEQGQAIDAQLSGVEYSPATPPEYPIQERPDVTDISELKSNNAVTKGELAIVERLDLLNSLLEEGMAVNIDGRRAGRLLAQSMPSR